MIYLYFVTALVPAVFIYDGLREGAVQTRAWAVRRLEDPVQFWAIMANDKVPAGAIEGKVQISSDGRCTMLRSTGNPDLDRRTCEALKACVVGKANIKRELEACRPNAIKD